MNQKIFDYFVQNHGLTLTESEYDDIQRTVNDDVDQMRCELINEWTHAKAANAVLLELIEEVILHAVRKTDNGGPIDRRNIQLANEWRMRASAHNLFHKKCGTALIVLERHRQILKERYTPKHDDGYTEGQLARAAIGYVAVAAHQSNAYIRTPAFVTEPHPQWPWDKDSWKPDAAPIPNLVKAGALIAAEIDRLLRLKNNTLEAESEVAK